MLTAAARRRTAVAAIVAAVGLALTPGAASAADAASRCPVVPGAVASGVVAGISAALATGPAAPETGDATLRALDSATPRVRTFVAGRTPQGRPLRYAVVGAPRAITDRRLAALRTTPDHAAAGASRPPGAAGAPPVTVWLTAGVHANETSGTSALLGTVAALAGTRSCSGRRILARVVTVVAPVQNPDGAARRTRTNAAGFDLNRDWSTTAQPETTAWWSALRRLPPSVAVDLHEEAGSGYFTPPYVEPVLPALSGPVRRVVDRVIAPAVDRALGDLEDARVRPVHTGYDLLYPGYADSALGLAFGAASMTFEQGSDPPFPVRVTRHRAAARAVLRTAADRAATIHDARAAQRRRIVRRTRTIAAWVVLAGARDPDRMALTDTLRRRGVRVTRLRTATRVRTVDPLHPRRRGRTVELPADSTVVDADQPQAAWIGVLLGDDTVATTAGADPWSLPRLASLEVVALPRPLPRTRVESIRSLRSAGVATGTAVSFAPGSAGALRLALTPRADGLPTRVAPDGRLWVRADVATARTAAAAGVRLQPEDGDAPAGTRPLRTPSVAIASDPAPPLAGPPATLAGPERPSGWLPWWLQRLGVPTTVLDAPSVPAGTTHLVLGPAAPPPGFLEGTGPAALRAFVERGGTLVLSGDAATAAARAGLTRVTAAPSATGAVHLLARTGPDPVGGLVGDAVRVVVAGDPRLDAPAGATVALRADDADARTPASSPGAPGDEAGRPLAVRERTGAGEVVTIGFSPLFRGWSPGGEAVLAALLLTPPG